MLLCAATLYYGVMQGFPNILLYVRCCALLWPSGA